MKTRNSRWMKWIVAESARKSASLPYERGATRDAFIAKRAVAASDSGAALRAKRTGS